MHPQQIWCANGKEMHTKHTHLCVRVAGSQQQAWAENGNAAGEQGCRGCAVAFCSAF